MYLLDTGILLDLREARRANADPALSAWAERVSAQHMFVSALTLLELEQAAALAAQRAKDLGAVWRDWLDRQIGPAFEGRVLSIDVAVIQRRAQISYTDDREGILAATALVHNLALVTKEPNKYRAGRVRVLDLAKLEFEGGEAGDWREATRSGAGWVRNLFVR